MMTNNALITTTQNQYASLIIVEGKPSHLYHRLKQFYQVQVAKTLEECLSLLPHSIPDLILIDSSIDQSGQLLQLSPSLSSQPPIAYLVNHQDDQAHYFSKNAFACIIKREVETAYQQIKALISNLKQYCHLVIEQASLYLRQGISSPQSIASIGSAHGLTKREKEILELISNYLTNNEIATKTGLASNTIKSHVGQIYKKFNVKGRRALLEKMNAG